MRNPIEAHPLCCLKVTFGLWAVLNVQVVMWWIELSG